MPSPKPPIVRLAAVLMPVLLTLLASTASVAGGLLPWQDRHYIERSFYDIALNAEYVEEGVPPVIKRWVRPLRVWVYSGAGDAARQRRLLWRHLQRLGDFARLSVRLVERREEANVEVFFASDAELAGLVARELPAVASRELPVSHCIGSIRYNQRAEIVHGTVVIPAERAQRDGKLESCIVEEVTQMLGLINDSRFARHTVFSDLTDDDRLTGLDYLLIRLLYSPALRAGMTPAEAMPRVRRQLLAWERIGLIRKAERLVARSEGPRLAGG